MVSLLSLSLSLSVCLSDEPVAKKARRTDLDGDQKKWWAARLATDYAGWKAAAPAVRKQIVAAALSAAQADATIGAASAGWVDAQAKNQFTNYRR